jgi:hypothetical protein
MLEHRKREIKMAEMYEPDGSDPHHWPSDGLENIYGDVDMPCLNCIVRSTCKRHGEDMCQDRYDYFKAKLSSN